MSPEEALRRASIGELAPVLLVSGEEGHLVSQVVKATREAALQGGIPGLNDESFEASSAPVEAVLGLARTLPMMAARRFILVRDVERWDEKEQKAAAKGKETKVGALDQLLNYAEAPSPSTVLLLVAPTLDKRRRLYTNAKKQDWLVACETPGRAELPAWIMERVKARGCTISRSVADLVAELAGPGLAPLADAVERLCLYAGEGNAIDEHAVSECVIRLRTASVWELVGAVGRRDLKAALTAFDDVYDPQDRGLPLIGILAWATRQLIRFDAARREGKNPADAAKAAQAPPFKARDLETQVRALSPDALARWLTCLAQADLDLKGGSKREPRAILTQMVFDLCQRDERPAH
jgi:DNA polymerase III subunit delta